MEARNSAPIACDYVLARMAPEVAMTFSPLQREALGKALAPRQHLVNIRLSLPLGWRRIYLVVLAGAESRSPERRRDEARRHSLWTPLNLLVMAGTVGVAIAALGTVLRVTTTDFSRFSDPAVAPVAVPFKTGRESCEQSGRVWQNDACLDFGHDPTF